VRPTIATEIAGVRRALEDLTTNRALDHDSVAILRGASKTLARLEKSSSTMLSYLLTDVAAVTATLEDISVMLPAEEQKDIQSLAVERRALLTIPSNLARINDIDETARALLSRAIALLPADPPGTTGPRFRIRSCLVASLENRPW